MRMNSLKNVHLSDARAAARRLGQWWLTEARAVSASMGKARSHAMRANLRIECASDAVVLKSVDRVGQIQSTKRIDWARYSRDELNATWAMVSPRGPRAALHLALSDQDAISQTLLVPSQARSRVGEIIREHVRRKTTWKPDDVLIGCEIGENQPERVEARFVLVPKTGLAKILAVLQLSESDVDVLEVYATGSKNPVPIFLKSPQTTSNRHYASIAAAAAFALVATVAISITMLTIQRSAALSELQHRLDTVVGSTKDLSGKMREVQGSLDRIDRLTKLRSAPSVVQLWEALAELLPDTVWLTDLEINGSKIRISGYARVTTEIIPLLSQSSLFSEVVLTAPIVVDAAKGNERFSIEFKLRNARLQFDGEA